MQDTHTRDTDDTQAPNVSITVTICVADNGDVIMWQDDAIIVVAPDDIERVARALLKQKPPTADRTGAERQRRYRARKRNAAASNTGG